MHCLTCGYDLQGLEDHRCPECGRGFDPSQPKSFGRTNTHRLLRGATVAGWCAGLVAVGAGVTAAIGIATGKHDVMLLILVWMIALMPLLIALMIYLSCLSACKRLPSMRALMIALLIFAFNASLITQWPIDAIFLMHRAELNQRVQQVIQNPSAATTPIRIGLFEIDAIYTKPNNNGNTPVYFQISRNTGSPDYLVYGMTDVEIETNFNIWSFQRLDANWHIVHED